MKTKLPYSLLANASLTCRGHELHGEGFKLSEEEANQLIAGNPGNAEVIFPLMNGKMLNNSPTFEPQGFVINFGRRTFDEAAAYPKLLEIVRARVKPERDLHTANAGRDRYLRENWWLFLGYRTNIEVYSRTHAKYLACAVNTKFLSFVLLDSKVVPTSSICCLLLDQFSYLAQLRSSFYEVWTEHYASARGRTISYVPSRCFNTFPFIVDDPQEKLEKIGCEFHKACSEQMISQQQGLTDLYNHFHNSNEKDGPITHLRELHEEMDKVVAAAYGWTDLDLRHGFYKIKKDMRYTISKASRNVVHERLLALNHERHEEKVKEGLHDKKLKSSGIRLKAVK